VSSSTIRLALTQFLAVPPIPGVGSVQREMGRWVDLVANGAAPDATTLVVRLLAEQDVRLSTPAVTGWRKIDYDVELVACHVFYGDGPDAADDLDGLLEQVKDRIRSDPLIGQPATVIFEVGQGPNPQIRVARGEPLFLDNDAVVTFVSVQFVASETVHA